MNRQRLNNEQIKVCYSIESAKLLYDKKIAFLMAWHPRLGKDSLIRRYVNKDIARVICERYLTFDSQYGISKGKNKILKKVDDMNIAITDKGGGVYGIERVDRGLNMCGPIYFQTPLLILSRYHGSDRYITLMCKEFGPYHHESKFLNDLHCKSERVVKDCLRRLILREKENYYSDLFIITRKLMARDEFSIGKGFANLGLLISDNNLKNGKLKIFERNRNRLLTRKSVHDAITKGPGDIVLKAIVSLSNVKKPHYVYMDFELSPITHQIRIMGYCRGLFEGFMFSDEDKYRLMYEVVDYKSLGRYLADFDSTHSTRLHQLFNPQINKLDRKLPIVYIQTPIMYIPFDVSCCFGEDRHNIINLGFDVKDASQVRFADDLSLLDVELTSQCKIYPIYKNTGSINFVKVSEKLPDYEYLESMGARAPSLEFKCYDSKGKKYTFREALPFLVRGCRVRAIYHYENILEAVYNNKIVMKERMYYVSPVLDQLQFFSEDFKDLNEYAFEDSSE